MNRTLTIAFCFLLSCQTAQKEDYQNQIQIITAGGTITEIVYALGFGEQIIATDITSTYPESMQELPSIGYRNQIKAEGVLSLGADLILAEEGYLTDDVVSQLKGSGIDIHFFKKPTHTSETQSLINDLAVLFDAEQKGKELINSLEADLSKLQQLKSMNSMDSPKVAFVMARGEEMVFIAGEDTFAATLIEMAGGISAGKGFKDFIPLTPEALVSMNPDYLLFFDSGIKSMGGIDGLNKIRGIDQTIAYQNDQILSFDGLYLSGFGPRVGQAAFELAKALGY
ncbi:heme/hemin ABC transporter substrate-binding protein [Mongoliibacter ruber]|uniref:Iron complex transport system substrate-binding protein n=1 Tax=Mongoliibacter ruber TaxID=1750599 RepID=A0A2T0WD53_9BACT|nr:ABC transporter substrate-binding protein [Mongoliibacter ruber]PRY84640.1 iron complex transport system substrate-binding protein [Mongoliibacter ruber]